MSTTDVALHSVNEEAMSPIDNYIFWFNSRPTLEGRMAIGPHLPCGNAQIDVIGERLKWEQYTVIHQDLEKKLYWKISPCSLIFIAQNIQSGQELRSSSIRKGIAHAWGPVLDSQTKQFKRNKNSDLSMYCRVRVRVFIHELVCEGFDEPFLFIIRGYNTDSLMAAAAATYRLTRALTEYRRRTSNTSDPVYFYSVSLPIKAAKEPVPAGDSSIYHILPDVPPRMDDAFIELHTVDLEMVKMIQQTLLVPAMVWSTQET